MEIMALVSGVWCDDDIPLQQLIIEQTTIQKRHQKTKSNAQQDKFETSELLLQHMFQLDSLYKYSLLFAT